MDFSPLPHMNPFKCLSVCLSDPAPFKTSKKKRNFWSCFKTKEKTSPKTNRSIHQHPDVKELYGGLLNGPLSICDDGHQGDG
jgi:hypothetical protein